MSSAANLPNRSICDPITQEIIRGVLRSVQREMELLVERTAMSPFIREKKDFFAALFDGTGRLISGTTMPTGGEYITPLFKHYPIEEMREGDIYWYNDCYGSNGAVSHTPDQVFILPVFSDGKPIAFSMTWAHFNDVGGMRSGSLSPDCTEIFQEGIIVPPVRLATEGVLNEELMRLFARNSRYPEMVRGDLRAAFASIRAGGSRIEELVKRFSREVIVAAFDQIADSSRRVVQSRMRDMFSDGEYRFTETLDSDGKGNGPFKLRYRLTVEKDRIELDLTKTDDQSPGAVNYLMSPRAPQVVFSSYLQRHDPLALSNHGYYTSIDEVKLRPGSILHPTFPAALGLRGMLLMRNVSACLGLMNMASDGKANANHSAYVILYVRGSDVNGKPFLMSDGIGVGYGGRPDSDGADAIYLVANENYPAEFVESVYPFRIRRYSINPDSGGAGRWRGGCGVIREAEVLAPTAMLSIRIDGTKSPPWGVNGGKSGGTGRCVINPGRPDEREINPVSDGNMVKRGDIIRIETGGGGGWGHPFDRETGQVLADVRAGFVSRDRAHDDYGVVITSDGTGIDEAATATRRADRPAVKLFHRHDYVEELQ